MKLSISPALSRRALQSHSWLGLLVSILLYWVCLSGTLVVFGQELMRWEQPTVNESLNIEAKNLQRAYQQMLSEQDELKGMTTLRLPTVDFPRAFLNANEKSWYIRSDGTLGAAKRHPVTDMLAELHAELLLPHSVGMVVVSVLGALLAALTLSGVVAHRRIFKDAFRWRRGNPLQQEADLHNRLSVWGLPFHLMIALTGAYFGLALLMASFYAQTQYDGDQHALFADVFGNTPQVVEYDGALDLPHALNELKRIAPNTQPLFVTFENAGKPNQYLLIGSQHLDKLIYSEQYRFDAMGNYIDAVGYANGQAGQEAIFSVYRLHFGHYAGEWMKIIYGVLGLALTVVCVTGINLWLKKRKHRDALNDLWVATVWGTPLAIVVAAIVGLCSELSVAVSFCGVLVLSLTYAAILKHPRQLRAQLVQLTAFALFVLVMLHVTLYGLTLSQPAALWVNSGLFVSALLMLGWLRTQSSRLRAAHEP